jgi:hypothetical protein
VKSKKQLIFILLSVDLLLIILGFLNLQLYNNKAGLPIEYQAKINDFSFDVKNIYKKEQIIEFDGKEINKNGLVDFYLLSHKYNDTVSIKSIGTGGKIIERKVVLPKKYVQFELVIMALVTLFFFFTGIFILIRYRNTTFSYIIHALSISTGIMIIFDWGDLITYSKLLNYIIFLFFEMSIYLVPTLFLHLSFTYPVKTKERSLFFLAPFYCAAVTFIIISYIQLTKIFFFGKDISELYYLNFHTTIADVYLVLVIILTIAKFEHSALTISDVTYKKQIYWALSGITFGPLIYVFLCLIPRILMGYELVSLVFMQFTTVVAPIMLLISVTRNKTDY